MTRMMAGCLVMLLGLGGALQARSSEGFEDLVRVVKAGADEETVLEYVNTSPSAYALTVDEILYPVEWGNSGVMTFIVNQQGKVYQKNLGKHTTEEAPRLDAYNPDATWHPDE